MNTLTERERLIKPAEASLLLAVSRRTLRRYASGGKLHAVKLNQRATRYRLVDVMRLMGKEITP
jgi:predicted site-specific integrase-resolvase